VQTNYEVYRGKVLAGYHETLEEALWNSRMTSIVKPGIVTLVDKATGDVIHKFNEGYEVYD
jgi:hypothetical protein